LNRRLLVVLGTVIAVFVIAIVGASSISLTGSDSAPGEGTTNAVCANALVVKSVVSTSGTVNSVTRVDVTGDMSQCVGEQMLVEVEREGAGPIWAVYNITTPISSLGLDLNASTGVFYDTKPTATANVLQVNGSRVAPVAVTDFGVITLTIARTWE
jgi:hypothetical protein